MLNNNSNENNINLDMPNDIFRNPNPSKSLPLWQKFALFFGGSVGLYILSFICSIILLKMAGMENGPNFSGIATFITYGALFIALLGVLNKNIIKVSKDHIIPNLFIGFGIGFGMIVVPIIYSVIISLFRTPAVSENEAALRSFLVIYPFPSILVLGIVGPICEELTYRVGLFNLFKKWKWLAYIISSLIFAFMHFGFDSPDLVNEFINLPIYLFCGFSLAFAYDFFGFWGSVAAHTFNNLYSVIMVLLSHSLGLLE